MKALRSNWDGEYDISIEFKDFLVDYGIFSQFIAPYTPQQNGVAKKRDIILLDMVHSMISYSSLPTLF